MCGIAGYVGPRPAVEVVFDQLKRLEYRGYDSAGIAFPRNGSIEVIKRAGKLSELGKLVGDTPPDARIAIAHSRWATHGAPTDQNAHPHFDQFKQVSIIHNGIIENYLDLKAELVAQGHRFQSETDTEIAAHVIGQEYDKGVALEEAVRLAAKRLRGAFALVVMSKKEPDKIVAVRNASPIVLGLGQGENMLASDIPALIPYTREVAILEDQRIGVLTKDAVRVFDLDGKEEPLKTLHVDWDISAAEKGGYEHFMLKEIHEQPEVIRQCLAGRLAPSPPTRTPDDPGDANRAQRSPVLGRALSGASLHAGAAASAERPSPTANAIRLENVFSNHVWHEIDRVNIIACGTAYHAGLMGKYMLENLLRLPTDVFYSSEFRYGDPVLSPKSLAIFVSQSGETADSLAALRLCKQKRIRTLGIVNVLGSSIARECDRVIFTQAGPEICVASTKAYTAQVLVLTLLALYIAQVQETPGVDVGQCAEALRRLPARAEEVLKLEPQIVALAEQVKDAPLFFFLGRGADAYVALEAALKMKEIAYVPTQESPAGEMKHGPLALVEKGVVAVFGATDPSLLDKTLSNMMEVKARGGTVVCLTVKRAGRGPEAEARDSAYPSGQPRTGDPLHIAQAADHILELPSTGFSFLNALLSAIALQLLAYHVARLKGCEIDQPRNLAKSVTVE